jgi:hypothetical protein
MKAGKTSFYPSSLHTGICFDWGVFPKSDSGGIGTRPGTGACRILKTRPGDFHKQRAASKFH